ncbi:MAG: siderophore-interacting protein [Aeromicrobium sp.]
MHTFVATVIAKRPQSAHLVTVTLGGLDEFPTTGVPDEYIRLLVPPAGAEVVPPEIDEATWTITYPEGAVELTHRVYTISDHRVVDGEVQVDIDIALHDTGIGSDWARDCEIGSRVGLLEPRGLYGAPADVEWQLLVADLTGVPALARILRGLEPGQRAEAVVVVADADDEIPLPSAGDVKVHWQVVERGTDISEALATAVTGRHLPKDGSRYVWLAGEARASRAVRRHLRRELGWPQSDFYTCGYWQIDAETWNARYEEVADQVIAEAEQAQARAGGDEGAYLDELEEIYEKAGL